MIQIIRLVLFTRIINIDTEHNEKFIFLSFIYGDTMRELMDQVLGVEVKNGHDKVKLKIEK